MGCVGVVQFLWHTFVISERSQPPLVQVYVNLLSSAIVGQEVLYYGGNQKLAIGNKIFELVATTGD